MSAEYLPAAAKLVRSVPSILEVAETLDEPDGGQEDEQRVTPLELFFDLVFVFALTQITQLIADEPDGHGLAKGMVLLALVWWAWSAYAWLTDSLDTNEDRVRLTMFAAMIAMFLAALTIPAAFDDRALVFACAYVVVRVAHVLLFAFGTREVTVRRAALALAPTVGVASALVLAASLFDGAAQGAIFVVAIAIDYFGGGRGVENFHLHPAYFAERYGLVIILVLGESIVATGIGAQGTDLGAAELVAAGVALVLSAALWWAYFDVVALVAERRLSAAEPGREQNTMARDSYSYLHLLLMAGVVLVALGSKKVLAHTDEPLKELPAIALCGGVALYLGGLVLFRLRNIGSLNGQRLLVAAVAVALIPVATQVDALLALIGVTALAAGLIAYEAIRFRDARKRIRTLLA
jgi:low temperature requirement protein LtrA